MVMIRNLRLARLQPPTFEGEWRGLPLTVKLDSSAIMYLEGNKSYEQLQDFLEAVPAPVTLGAQRLLEMRRETNANSHVVVLSALDLQ